jgi:hypothetical protein
MRKSRRRWMGVSAAALVLTSAACTALLDHNAAQCKSDDDCAHFGNHPYCQGGVCVSSGLGPADCFFGTPQQPQDFLNQCTTAQCVEFDNCQRLGLCADASDLDAALVSPPAPQAASPPPTDDGGAAVAPSLPSCMDPTNGRAQVIYMTGSSNFPPLLAKLAPLIVTATGFTPVFEVTNSCTGVESVFGSGAQLIITDPAPSPSAKYAAYFAADGSATPCTLGPSGVPVDVGESDIFSTTCNGVGPPTSTIGEFLGPVQAMVFVVPGQSQETAITAAAAREVFGMGGGSAAPWTNPLLYFIRNSNTGTQQEIGHAIGVPANEFWGVDRGTAANVDALMKGITDPTVAEQAIGIISADYYDDDRANLVALAFQAEGQDCAYLPDSTQFKKDKRNVRDGHYPVWGPLHFFAAVNNGDAVSPGAQAFVSVVAVPNVPQTLLDAFIGSSLVPSCAMSVERGTELGPLSAYAAPFQCGCYFESSPDVNGTAPPGCTPCITGNDCVDPTRPACNLGFCETQ